MKVNVEKQPKSTVKLTVSIPNEKVKQEYAHLMEEVVKNAELPGFRKGMAPREMVEEKTDTAKIYGEVVNNLLQNYYPQALKENQILPVSNPKVEIKEFAIDKDFEFVATVAVRPQVKIGDYKKQLKEYYETRLKQVREENAKKLQEGQSIEEPHIHLSPNEAIEEISKAAEVEVPELLVEDETDRMMSRLVNQAQSIGLSLDQYLKAQNKTSDQLREEYKIISEKNLKAEFVLSELVKEEKVEASEEEIREAVLASGQDPEAFKDDVQKWYIKSILEKNKLLANLIEAAEVAGGRTGEHKHE